MAMTGGGGRGAVKSDINVTPLVDVCLVLLIIFMVVTPLLQRGKPVVLPKSQVVDQPREDAGDPLMLTVTPDKRIWVENDPYTLDSLGAKLQDEIIAEPYRPIMLKGDSSLSYGDVRKIMAVARTAGARGVELAVEQPKTAQNASPAPTAGFGNGTP